MDQNERKHEKLRQRGVMKAISLNERNLAILEITSQQCN
jgi:hypothetical protein